MIEYPKIDTVWERDGEFHVIPGRFRRPEFETVRRWLLTEKVDGTNTRVQPLPDGNVWFWGAYRRGPARGRPGGVSTPDLHPGEDARLWRGDEP